MNRQLEKILKMKQAREKKLRNALSSITDQLKDRGAVKIILFGSLARGDVDIHTDLDIIVVMPPTKSGKEWSGSIYENLTRGVASDIFVYNTEEFEQHLKTSDFLRHAVDTGKVIHETTA